MYFVFVLYCFFCEGFVPFNLKDCKSYPWHHEAPHDKDEEEELLDDEDHCVRVHL